MLTEITISVDQYGNTYVKRAVSVADTKDAIDWLIEHNGDAPEVAQTLLFALKVAVERCELSA